MTKTVVSEASIGVTEFKSHCLELISQVERGKKKKIVLTKRNRPVVEIVAVRKTGEKVDLWGALKGTVKIAPGVDLTEPLGEKWGAEQE